MFLQNVMDALASPDDLFAERADEVPLWQPALVVVAVVALNVAVAYYQAQHIAYPPEVPETARSFGTIFAVAQAVLVPFIGWVVIAAVLHGLSALAGADRGGFAGTFRDVGWGYAPGVIDAGIRLVASWFALQQLATPIPIQSFVARLQSTTIMQGAVAIGILVALWQGVIWTFAVHHGRGLSKRRAAAVVAVPVALPLALAAWQLF